MDADTELLRHLVTWRCLPHSFHNLERTKTTLRHHVIAIEYRHQSVASEFVHITAIAIDQVHLHCKLGVDEREQFIGSELLRESGEVANVRKKDYNFALDG